MSLSANPGLPQANSKGGRTKLQPQTWPGTTTRVLRVRGLSSPRVCLVFRRFGAAPTAELQPAPCQLQKTRQKHFEVCGGLQCFCCPSGVRTAVQGHHYANKCKEVRNSPGIQWWRLDLGTASV